MPSRHFRLFEDARFAQKPLQTRHLARWRIKGREKLLPLLGIQAKMSTISQSFFSLSERAFHHEFAHRAMSRGSGSIDSFFCICREPKVEFFGAIPTCRY